MLARAVVAGTRWLQLITLKYRDAAGKERAWDAVHRATTPLQASSSGERIPDAVAILALLRPPASSAPAAKPDQGLSVGQPSVVLVRQFRPPLDAHTIELPAGLVDAGETPATAALRELKEETGFIGKALNGGSAPLALSPGLTSETVSVVQVDVDMSLPANTSPVAEPDEGEYVETLVVPIEELASELDRRERDGDVIFAAVRTLTYGLAMGRGKL